MIPLALSFEMGKNSPDPEFLLLQAVMPGQIFFNHVGDG